jgi:hypothetical protein
MIMERIAELLPPTQRGVYAGAVEARTDHGSGATPSSEAARTPTATKA